MAKKQSSKKKGKTNLDKEYILGLRKSIEFNIKRLMNKNLKSYSFDEIHSSIQLLKEGYNTIIDEPILEYMSYVDFCTYIDYIGDLYLATDSGGNRFNTVLKGIKNRIVPKLQESDTKWEFFISLNRIGAKLEVYSSRPDMNIIGITQITTAIMLIFSIYITTYIIKMKNKTISKFYDDNGHINIQYGPKELLTREEVDALISISEFETPKLFSKAIQKVIAEVDIQSSNYSVADIAQEYLSLSSQSCLKIDKDLGEYPFTIDGSNLISIDDLKSLPNNRLYAIPSSGIRFEFLNKDKNIDYIEMKESKGKLVFCINLINNGGIYVGSDTETLLQIDPENCSIYEYKEKSLKIPFTLSIKHLESAWTLESIVFNSKFIATTPIVNTDIFKEELKKWMYTCLCCVYMAYYNPKMFENMIRLHNIDRTKKSGYSKQENYRVAHLRKLPIGYKISEEAIKEAAKNGFNYIPEGYTFVSASNLAKEPESKRVITIKV